jgi:hypothetical protein
MSRLSACAAALALSLTAIPASAQGLVQAGVLECRGGPTVGLVVGSITEFNCLYNGNVGPQQVYRAIVRRLGVDLGYTEATTLVWTVLAPTAQIGLGDLAGNFAGAQANASIGGGAGANALVGGSNNSFALQPLSVQGQAGLNVSAGVASLELRFGR